MNWLNLEVATLTSAEFLGSPPVARATWLCLMRYCAQHETGGKIVNCKDWGDRRWQQVVGITKQEAEDTTETDLWEWVGTGLIVMFYPVDKEEEVRVKRDNGKRYGRGMKKAIPKQNNSSANSTAIALHIANGIGKGKEGKGKEREEKKEPEIPAGSGSAEIAFSEPSWETVQYVESLKTLAPEYRNLNDGLILKTLKTEEDPELRSAAYNDCIGVLVGGIDVHTDPLRVLQGYLRNARQYHATEDNPDGITGVLYHKPGWDIKF